MDKTIQKLKFGEPVTLAALGDSLTSGWMVHKGYLDFLEEMIAGKFPEARLTILNRGIPGDTAAGGLQRLQRDVLTHDPDLVLIQFGLNDAFCGCAPEEFKRTVRWIIQKTKGASSADLLLLTSTDVQSEPDSRRVQPFYDCLQALSAEEAVGIARVDRYWRRKTAGSGDFLSLVQADGVHPSEEGYRLMAVAVMEAIT